MPIDICLCVKKLDNYIGRSLYQLYSKNSKGLPEITRANMWVLDFLYQKRNADVYQKDIEARYFINRATASKMLKRMEEKGLIRRTASEQDYRKKKLELTETGLSMVAKSHTVRRQMEKKVTSALTEEECREFRRLCLKIIDRMRGEMDGDNQSIDALDPRI